MEDISSAADTIIANDEMHVPIILEDRFIKDVIPILVRPWDKKHLEAYKRFVVELTNPLRVATNEREPKVAFVVPALYPRPSTTWSANGQTASIAHVVDYIALERSRSIHNLDPYITEYLSSVSIKSTVDQSVLLPLAHILAMYGRTFEDEQGQPLYSLGSNTAKPNGKGKLVAATADEQSSFSNDLDYED